MMKKTTETLTPHPLPQAGEGASLARLCHSLSRLRERAGVRVLWCFLALLLLLPFQADADALVPEKVVSEKGIEAWLSPDPTLPVLSLHFAFAGGMVCDPAGKAGTAYLLSTLLDEGAGDLDSQAFQRRLASKAIGLSFWAGREWFGGNVKTLSANRADAFDLLTLALSKPRFDDEPVTRMRNTVLVSAKSNLVDPDWLQARAVNHLAFSGHPYGRPGRGLPDTLTAVTVDDLRGFMRDHMGRDRLIVTVAGDITPEALKPVLDQIFGGLPETSTACAVPDTTVKGGRLVRVAIDNLPQVKLSVLDNAIPRSDPDWYAASLMNAILGGSGFASRLMTEVREKRGLTYGIGSGIEPMNHASLLTAGGSTTPDKAAEALETVKAVWRGMGETGVTQQELDNARSYVLGTLALDLTSTDAIAQILLDLRMDGLPIDQLARRTALFNAVTREDVQRAAKRLLDPNRLLVVYTGAAAGLLPDQSLTPADLIGQSYATEQAKP